MKFEELSALTSDNNKLNKNFEFIEEKFTEIDLKIKEMKDLVLELVGGLRIEMLKNEHKKMQNLQ